MVIGHPKLRWFQCYADSNDGTTPAPVDLALTQSNIIDFEITAMVIIIIINAIPAALMLRKRP